MFDFRTSRLYAAVASTLLATLLFAADAGAQPVPAQPTKWVASGVLDRVWIGPRPFRCPEEVRRCQDNLMLREDWLPTLVDASKWPTVLQHTRVLKTYILLLQDKSNSSKASASLSDAQLDQLVQFTRTHNLMVAFEVGGLRTSAEVCGNQAGEVFAQRELTLLKRWLKAGGQIGYITADHAVMKNMRGVGFTGSGLGANRECKMTVRELTEELADYFQAIHKEIPAAKLGVIESLGFFRVRGAGGEIHKQTDPGLPDWQFTDYFDDLLKAMKQRKLELDHFHIDFGFSGARFDARPQKDRLNFARVLAVETYVQSKGVRSGVIFNSTLDDNFKNAGGQTANREMHARTLSYFSEYAAAGGNADDVVIQSWDPYPDATGPEDLAYTFFNIARDIVKRDQRKAAAAKPAAAKGAK